MKPNKKTRILLILGLTISFHSCSLDRFVIRQSAALLDYGVLALFEETDLILAEQALAADIKLIEGMIKGDPENQRLLLLASQAFSGYTLGFVEDESPERAKQLYLRGRNYGFRALLGDTEYESVLKEPLDRFNNRISGIEKDDLEPLFWAAFAWAGWITLSLDNPRALIDLPKVQVMMQRVLDLDDSFFHGAAYLFFGSIWGSRPPMLGGDPEKAKQYFEKNLEITQGKFLLTHIYYTQYYAIKTMNEEIFDQLIKQVEETSPDVLPGFQLLNVIAKKKADILKERRENYF
jgi:hypothetical protein